MELTRELHQVRLRVHPYRHTTSQEFMMHDRAAMRLGRGVLS